MRGHGRAVAPRVVPLLVRAVTLAAVGLAVTAGPAAADAPAPGDYTSEVVSITPDPGTIDLEVVGGDSFLELTVDRGIEVVVVGYEGEPYLRVRADGTVEENQNSPATYLNEDRYAEIDVPPSVADADPTELEPDWETVGSGGRYAWHDHRIHWMAPNAPPAVARGGTFDWNGPVQLVVDGDAVAVNGRITYQEAVSPVPWAVLGLVVAGAMVVADRRLAVVERWVLPLAGVAVAAAGAFVAWTTLAESPAGVGASNLPVVTAGIAVLAGIAAVLLPARRVRPIALLLVGSVLGTWGLLRIGVLTSPVLPTSAPFALDRAVTALAIAVAAAIIVVVVPSAMSSQAPDTERS